MRTTVFEESMYPPRALEDDVPPPARHRPRRSTRRKVEELPPEPPVRAARDADPECPDGPAEPDRSARPVFVRLARRAGSAIRRAAGFQPAVWARGRAGCRRGRQGQVSETCPRPALRSAGVDPSRRHQWIASSWLRPEGIGSASSRRRQPLVHSLKQLGADRCEPGIAAQVGRLVRVAIEVVEPLVGSRQRAPVSRWSLRSRRPVPTISL